MKQYIIIVAVQDGEFEYIDQTILAWDGDPKDQLGILVDYTGDTSMEESACGGGYETQSDYRVYSLCAIKEIDENDLPVLRKYGF